MGNNSGLENPFELICSVNKAFLCEIRPNMRRASAEYIKEEKRFILYIFWDKPMTQEEENYDISGTILTDIGCDFLDPDVSWEDENIVVPYPQRLPEKGISIFRRYEPTPPGEF